MINVGKYIMAVIIASFVALILFLSIGTPVYNAVGWGKPVTFDTGDMVSFTPAGNKDVSRLRFKNCTFTIKDTNGKTSSQDVTAILNGMAVAYAPTKNSTDDNGKPTNPATLDLVGPLNAFSFVISGVNDSKTVLAGDNAKAPWCATPPPSCTVGTTGAASGCPYNAPCGSDGTCPLCEGATATLVVSMRTL